jgi:hypothetical protein
MKERYKSWLKLTASPVSNAAEIHERATPIVMRSQEAVRILERRLLIGRDSHGNPAPGIEDPFSQDVFGIVPSETWVYLPANYDELPLHERLKADAAYDEHEDQFKTDDMTDDEAVEHLLMLGLDFRDERGFPLRCTKILARAAEAAAKGICGARLPDREAAALEIFSSALQRDAAAFQARKRGR